MLRAPYAVVVEEYRTLEHQRKKVSRLRYEVRDIRSIVACQTTRTSGHQEGVREERQGGRQGGREGGEAGREAKQGGRQARGRQGRQVFEVRPPPRGRGHGQGGGGNNKGGGGCCSDKKGGTTRGGGLLLEERGGYYYYYYY